MAGHAKASSERCPSWRQLYRLTATLCEVAGVAAPKTAADASALIDQLDALTSGTHEAAAVGAVTVTTGSDCDIPF